MPLTSIVTIVLRLFGLWWIFEGLISIMWSVPDTISRWGSGARLSVYFVPLLMLAIGFLLIMWSRSIARAVTPKPEQSVEVGGLVIYDLYCFAFVFLGLYFVLSNVSSVVNWAHFLAVKANHEAELNEQKMSNFYSLTDPLIRLIAGAACLIGAPRFARKLAAAHGREIKAAAATPPPQ